MTLELELLFYRFLYTFTISLKHALAKVNVIIRCFPHFYTALHLAVKSI